MKIKTIIVFEISLLILLLTTFNVSMSIRLVACGFPIRCPNNCQKPAKDLNGCYKCNCGIVGKCPPKRSCGCGTYLDKNGCEVCGCTFDENKNSNKNLITQSTTSSTTPTTTTTSTTTFEDQPEYT